VTYNVADSRGLAQWLYQIEGRERITTPAGEFNAVKLVRTKDNQRAELWLADEIGKFPVQARVLYKDGSRLEQVAVRVSAPPPQ
jgi:negative regulator of sigma E activity